MQCNGQLPLAMNQMLQECPLTPHDLAIYLIPTYLRVGEIFTACHILEYAWFSQKCSIAREMPC